MQVTYYFRVCLYKGDDSTLTCCYD